ncbi:MAG: hypothetical protein ACYTEZ_14360 [Planctomycetota bacterium]|jgi:hypothetical protein
MRTAFRLLPLGLAGLIVLAAPGYAQSLEAKLDAKLEEPFVQNAAWVTDYDQARKQAKEQNKLIFAYFTRSYAP